MIDLDAIEARWKTQRAARGITRDGYIVFNEDVPALIAEVRRLEAALAYMTKAHNDVFNLWEEASRESARLLAEVRRLTTPETHDGYQFCAVCGTALGEAE